MNNKITFIPDKQKNIYLRVNKNNKVIIGFIVLFVIYILLVGLFYWFFLLREQSKIDNLISELDSKNSVYYPKGLSLEQTLFNLNDIVNNAYNPIPVITNIESAYLPNSVVSSFFYNKTNKIITIAMQVPSLTNVSAQVQKFSLIDGVAKVDSNSIESSINNSLVSFGVEIRLK